jgi:hypothetical protein
VDWGKRRGTVCSFTKRHEAYVLLGRQAKHGDRADRDPRNGSEIPVIERVIVMGLKPLLALSAILQRQRLG